MQPTCKDHPLFLPKMLLFCLAALLPGLLPPLTWAQEPALTLEDSERQTSVALYASAESGGPEDFYLYVNSRFSYFGYIPFELTTVVAIPDNDDGLMVASADEKATLRMSGGFAEFIPGGLEGSFNAALQDMGQEPDYSLYVDDELKKFWELEWTKEGIKHYRKLLIKEEVMSECEFSYPLSEKNKYHDMADTIISTFNRDYANGED